MLKDAKYLLALIPPISAFFAVYFGGFWSYSTVIITFGIVPILDFLLPKPTQNFDGLEEPSRLSNQFFDWMLYLNLPLHFAILWIYFSTISSESLMTYEVIGMTLSVGIIVSTVGINVAHELGHRKEKHEQLMSKILLMTALYMHFFIEHNQGHHKNVATPEDPATSRYGESIYAFWFRSTKDSYLDAWKLENERLRKKNTSILSIHNQMIWFQIIQVLYLSTIGFLFGWKMVLFAITIAAIGFLLLESVNYIEHYGLMRKKLPSGRYENVMPTHSWNSNHEVGRILLYELTRHSDHHFKSTRKYQVLRHFDESPQLPYGYPNSILLALIPPLWFRLMNKKVEGIMAIT